MGDVLDRSDHVEVRGRSASEVSEALQLLDAARLVQRGRATAAAADLLRAMAGARMAAVPVASLAQAQRLAALKATLLDQGAYNSDQLTVVRHASGASSVRTWLARAREAHKLFAVKEGGRTLVPAFQLTEAGEIRPEISALLGPLLTAGIDGWQLWAWLTSPTSLLSGQAPVDVAVATPDRALRAATRHAAGVTKGRSLTQAAAAG
jgi:hypothetical protein